MARILLAEDDDNVRAFVARALGFAGHEVTECEDGGLAAEAMQAAERRVRPPALRHQDAGDGRHRAGARRRRGLARVTIVLMTGFADQRERAHGLEALIYDVIPKPFSLAQLMREGRRRAGAAGRSRSSSLSQAARWARPTSSSVTADVEARRVLLA